MAAIFGLSEARVAASPGSGGSVLMSACDVVLPAPSEDKPRFLPGYAARPESSPSVGEPAALASRVNGDGVNHPFERLTRQLPVTRDRAPFGVEDHN
jgi:hypothetical protein